MIVDKIVERANAVSGACDAEIEQIDYDQTGDDVAVYVYFNNGFNNGEPIFASAPSSELVDRDMFEFVLRLRFGVAKTLRATA